MTSEPPRLARWLKDDGTRVAVGESICEIETDNASVEVAAWAAGVLRHLAREGDAVGERDPIARIE